MRDRLTRAFECQECILCGTKLTLLSHMGFTLSCPKCKCQVGLVGVKNHEPFFTITINGGDYGYNYFTVYSLYYYNIYYHQDRYTLISKHTKHSTVSTNYDTCNIQLDKVCPDKIRKIAQSIDAMNEFFNNTLLNQKK